MSSVGQAIGGLIGAVAGFFMGGGPAGALKGFSIGASIGGMLDPPKGPNQTGPRLTDLSAQTSTYGTAIPRIYGTIATLGNIFWLQGDKLTEVVTVSKQKSGGKGGSKATNTTYSYNATFAVGLCQGPIDGVRRIWVGANLIYDAGSDDLETIIASNAAASSFRVYRGTEDQLPDPSMQADKGVANTPAYRGLAYIVFYDFKLKDYGNSLLGAQVKVEVVKCGEYSFNSHAETMPVSGKHITYDGHQLCAISGNNLDDVALSPDGITWRSYKNAAVKMWSGIASNGRGFVVIAEATTEFAVSKTGMDWALLTISAETVYWRAIKWTGAEYFAIGTDYGVNNTFSAVSNGDGSSWEVIKNKLPPRNHTDMAYADNVAVAISYGGYCATSSDFGMSWVDQAMPVSANWVSIAHNGSVFCAVASSGTACATSSDGETWVLRDIGDFAHTKIIACGNRLLVLSSTTVIATSDDDGVTWTQRDVENGINATDAAWNGAWAVVVSGSNSVVRLWESFSDDTVSLSSIIGSETSLSGLLDPGDIETSSITAEIRGYRISETGTIRSALEPLQGAFPFDVIQKGYQIAFVPRGGASVKTISDDLLDARDAGSAPGVALTTSREMDSQLPRRVSIKYFDNAREYDISEQYSERLNTDAVNVLDMTLPIVLTATEAAGVGEKLLYLYWLERYNLNFTLPPECVDLEPGDVITLTGDDYTYEIRLTEINYTSGGWLECRGRFNNAAIYTPNAIGEDDHIDPRPIVFGGPSYYILLDIPCLQDVFNAPGFPAAMCGYSTNWPGGVIFRSNDEGQTWTDVQGFIGSVPIGIALSVLAAGRTDIIDTTNTLSASLLAGELFSVTRSQMLNGANYFAIGAHGRWEIVAAQNCTLQLDGSYILSDFLRGRFGTEWAMTTHAIGDAVVLLTDADMAWIGMESASIGLSREYRGITAGAAIDTDVSLDFAYSGVNLECLSPVYLNGSRHPTTNDWILTWIRRTRIDGSWRDYVDAALGETTESYEVDIYADDTYAVVKRTITATSQTCAYTSAQQVTDFGSDQSTLYVNVYQLSATVGRGYPLTTSITR